MFNQKAAAIDFYISLSPIGATAWSMMNDDMLEAS